MSRLRFEEMQKNMPILQRKIEGNNKDAFWKNALLYHQIYHNIYWPLPSNPVRIDYELK